MEEDTNNDQTQLQKMRGLISHFKPSDKKVKLLFLSSSVIGIIVCTYLLARAYIYQKRGLSFFCGSEFIDSKIFSGYEGEMLWYIGYFLQVFAINTTSLAEEFLDLISRIGKLIVILGTVALYFGLWLYCTSVISNFVGIGYLMLVIFSMGTLSNINFMSNQAGRNHSLESAPLMMNCMTGLAFCVRNSFLNTD